MEQARGHHEAALAHYIEGLQLHQELGDKQGMARCHLHLGAVAQAREAREGAVSHFQQSFELSTAVGDLAGVADAASALGALFTSLGLAEEGLEWTTRGFMGHLALGSPSAQGAVLRFPEHRFVR